MENLIGILLAISLLFISGGMYLLVDEVFSRTTYYQGAVVRDGRVSVDGVEYEVTHGRVPTATTFTTVAITRRFLSGSVSVVAVVWGEDR
ncbi:hypothetical protein KC887_07200 [Candidatus Kaiserbacteria bacterium]|nr:hypothetical protein [Candidatus Kaiserbacteria bacterium]